MPFASHLVYLKLIARIMRLSSPKGILKGDLVNLESINLDGCLKLTTLPDSIGNLINLKTLDLRFCYKLTTLPERIGDLSNPKNYSSSWKLTSPPRKSDVFNFRNTF